MTERRGIDRDNTLLTGLLVATGGLLRSPNVLSGRRGRKTVLNKSRKGLLIEDCQLVDGASGIGQPIRDRQQPSGGQRNGPCLSKHRGFTRQTNLVQEILVD